MSTRKIRVLDRRRLGSRPPDAQRSALSPILRSKSSPRPAIPLSPPNASREQVPDVITLDIEMPRMDGLTFLKKIMSQHPIPVVICSSLAEEGAQSTLRALEYGAVDIITKPRLGTKQFLEESRITLCEAVKAAAAAQAAYAHAQPHGRAQAHRRCHSFSGHARHGRDH